MKFTTPKLADCQQHGPDSELYIVEGDSAARSVLRVRNPLTQAVLPMQGKPMNAIKATADELHRNIQFGSLLDTLNVNLKQIAAPLSIRYQKIVLLFDPDADGIHGRTLMLLFFYRWLPELLDAGRIYDVHAPQWVVTSTKMSESAYASTPEHFGRIKAYLKQQHVTDIKTKRFRGLGSVDAEILKSQCVDQKSRTLSVLTREHAVNALALFERLRSGR